MPKQILVLKTSLTAQSEVEEIGILLDRYPQIIEWNVDLEDCDKVLRIVSNGLMEVDIVEMLHKAGCEAEELTW
jgi:hypothetical protein